MIVTNTAQTQRKGAASQRPLYEQPSQVEQAQGASRPLGQHEFGPAQSGHEQGGFNPGRDQSADTFQVDLMDDWCKP